jgi:DNA-binding NarL/FixJ family response regulator
MPARILIIDANAAAAQVTRAIVERAAPGAQLAVAPDLQAAYRELQGEPPDVLIIDPAPHPLAGVQLAAAVKRRNPRGQVIVLASAPTAALRRQMQGLGVDLYLEKPAPLLVEELRRLLQPGRRAEHQDAA